MWILRQGEAVPVAVTVGMSDGRMTEVIAGALEPGMHVITEIASVSK